jgi:hypothetical protein
VLTILYSCTVGYHLTILYSCTVGYHLKEVQVGAHTVQLYSRLSSNGGAGRCSYCTAVQ